MFVCLYGLKCLVEPTDGTRHGTWALLFKISIKIFESLSMTTSYRMLLREPKNIWSINRECWSINQEFDLSIGNVEQVVKIDVFYRIQRWSKLFVLRNMRIVKLKLPYVVILNFTGSIWWRKLLDSIPVFKNLIKFDTIFENRTEESTTKLSSCLQNLIFSEVIICHYIFCFCSSILYLCR